MRARRSPACGSSRSRGLGEAIAKNARKGDQLILAGADSRQQLDRQGGGKTIRLFLRRPGLSIRCAGQGETRGTRPARGPRDRCAGDRDLSALNYRRSIGKRNSDMHHPCSQSLSLARVAVPSLLLVAALVRRPISSMAQSASPFMTGASALQTNILAWLTPVAIILVMVLGGMAMANRHVVGVVHRRNSRNCHCVWRAANRHLGSRNVRRLGAYRERITCGTLCRPAVRRARRARRCDGV